MKKLLCLYFLFAIYTLAKGQIITFDSASIKNGITEKGIYLCWDEFIQNSPSIKSEFLIKERGMIVQGLFFAKPNILKVYIDSLNKYKRIKDQCWGLFDGTDIYLVINKKCYKVEIMGQFSKYKIHVWRIVFVNTGMYSIPVPIDDEDNYIIDFTSDNRYRYTLRDFKKLLLKEDESLYNSFITEKRKRKKIDIYLKYLNDN